MSAKVYFLHAIDTEGPLYESLDATFSRLDEIFGVKLKPSCMTLKQLQEGQLDLGEKTMLIQEALSSHRVSTLGTWRDVDAMLEQITSEAYRKTLVDANGNGWVFNWFCLDHVGFVVNPRRRDMGFHNIHDHYVELVASQPESRDQIQWHFHPMSTYREAHRCATHYFRSDEIFQILTRRIIERNFFPSCFRAGFQAERPDSHWFLEQYIPFDVSNMATENTTDVDLSIDFRNGRSGNWRKAPYDWSVYHPSHDDYQLPGQCRRLIGRALNLRNRISNLTLAELERAFARAATGQDALVGLCSHDWRDMKAEMDLLFDYIREVKRRFPGVAYEFCSATEAFLPFVDPCYVNDPPLQLEIQFKPATAKDVPSIQIDAVKGRVFGPQPFLAIKTRSHVFLHDNLDFDTCAGRWHYAFHADTLPLDDVHTVAVAANDFHGRTSIARLSFV